MPTYEYRCPRGHDFERFYKTISASMAEVPCPECGETGTRQMSAGAGLMFKGSGFYLTDYGKNAHRGESAKASGDSSPKADASKAESAKPKADAPAAAPKSESAKPKPSKPKSE